MLDNINIYSLINMKSNWNSVIESFQIGHINDFFLQISFEVTEQYKIAVQCHCGPVPNLEYVFKHFSYIKLICRRLSL